MRVRIVCYEDIDGWILGKFAKKLNEELVKLSIDSDIGKLPDYQADINHHIIYCNYNGEKTTTDTIMITHIDSLSKVNLLKKQLKHAEMGICMSSSTMKMLKDAGLPKEKLRFINPAQDGVIRPIPMVLGITSKTHNDGRKKENILRKIAEEIKPTDFSFKIMGDGWHDIVSSLKLKGFTVEYYNKFDYQIYVKMVPTFDYFLYFSDDEGSMGFIDALAAGVKTIVTPQGYHLDAVDGISYSINNYKEIIETLGMIALERNKLINSVALWTWEIYAKKHLEIWQYLLGKNSDGNCFTKEDLSVIPDSNLQNENTNSNTIKFKIYLKLFINSLLHIFNKVLKRIKINNIN